MFMEEKDERGSFDSSLIPSSALYGVQKIISIFVIQN